MSSMTTSNATCSPYVKLRIDISETTTTPFSILIISLSTMPFKTLYVNMQDLYKVTTVYVLRATPTPRAWLFLLWRLF